MNYILIIQKTDTATNTGDILNIETQYICGNYNARNTSTHLDMEYIYDIVNRESLVRLGQKAQTVLDSYKQKRGTPSLNTISRKAIAILKTTL